ncbi:MAG TPA: CHAD domain-containing protein [Candidatus Elarobacter sp.]|nr:CHAD domain-containing protein [Candidatus Elarobacter sp.]
MPHLKPASPAREVARAAFAGSLARLVRQDPLLRTRPNEDAVHDARVAVRRLRSDLRTFRPLLDEPWARGLSERMRWLQDGFAEARDADVLLGRMRRHAERLSGDDRRRADAILDAFGAERERAYLRMQAMLNEPRYADLLRELIDLVRRPRCRALANEPACDVLPWIVEDAWSGLRKRVRRRSRPTPDAELHRIRIAAKRARYAAEAAVSVLGGRARRLAHAVEAIQTVLGEQHDAVVGRARLRAWANHEDAAFVAGQLSMLEELHADEGRQAWLDAWRCAKDAHRELR